MGKRWLRWLWSRRRLATGLVLAVGLIGVNAIAFMQAWSMTHYVLAGSRTVRPESLSRLGKLKVLLTGVTVPKPTNQATPESVGLDFGTHRFESSDEIELEAWYVPCETSRGLILMFHGYASCKGELVREAAAFHKMGYSTFLVDFRGSGGSSGRTTSVGVFEADDVAGAWDYAGSQWPNEQRILFGQSMGAAAILRAIAMHDISPAGLLLECPFDRLSSTVANRFTAMGLPAIPLAQLLVFWGGVQQGFNGFRHNPSEYAKSVKAPTLLLQGDCDLRVTQSQAENILNNISGPKILEVFVGAGHESLCGRDSESWSEAVSRFLNDWGDHE